MEKQLLKRSFINIAGLAVYVLIVANILNNGERIFGKVPRVLGPVAFLMLFVLSATISGGLVLGKPLLMYLDGDKRGSVKLIFYEVAWMAALTTILLVLMVVF